MEIVFVRHAEPEWVRDKLNVDNPPLTQRGHEQAALLGKWASTEHFDEVFVSPLVRTQQTASPILDSLQMDLVIAPWLEEIRNPIWHG
ncbi:MAG: histidine phosphatase family protein, partial [Actinomycetota bacterium]